MKNQQKIIDLALFFCNNQGFSKKEIFSLYAKNTVSTANSVRSFYYRNKEEIDALITKNTREKRKNWWEKLKEKLKKYFL